MAWTMHESWPHHEASVGQSRWQGFSKWFYIWEGKEVKGMCTCICQVGEKGVMSSIIYHFLSQMGTS